MKKLRCIADVHLGNHQRHGGPLVAGLNMRCRKIETVLYNACSMSADDLFVLGDLYDTASPSPQICSAAMNCFHAARGSRWVLKGNHDSISDEPGDHALGPLDFTDTRVVESPLHCWPREPDELGVIMIPYQAGPASSWLPNAISSVTSYVQTDKPANIKRVLMLHLGISDDNTAPWLRNAHDSINVYKLAELCAKHEIHYVMAGNWHEHCKWKINHKGWDVEVCQIGALVPTGWDNPGLTGYGGYATVTVNGIEWQELPGPRFVKLQGNEEEVLKAIRDAPDPKNLYVRLLSYPEYYKKACAFVEGLVENNVIPGGEVEMDTAEAKADAKRAAQAATSADSLKEAIEAFVSNMDLDPQMALEEGQEGVFRSRVNEMSNSYLIKVR